VFCMKAIVSSLDFQNNENQVIEKLFHMKTQDFLSYDAVSIGNFSPTFRLYHLGPP